MKTIGTVLSIFLFSISIIGGVKTMRTVKLTILNYNWLKRFIGACILITGASLLIITSAAADTISIQPGQPVTGNLPTQDAINVYELTLHSDGYITIDFEHAVLTGTDFGWRITLYDDQDTWLEEFTSRLNQAEASSASIGLAAGIYYVKVDLNVDSFGRPRSGWTHSNEDYKITVNYTVSDYWEKEPNNSLHTATEITVNTDYMGSLNYKSDVDYFVFRLTSDGYITIDFEHIRLTGTDNGWRITLYDGKDTWLEEFTSRLNQSEASSASIGLAAGIYYVKVDLNVDSFGRPRSGWTNSTEDYTMTVNYTVSDYWEKEPNNNLQTATEITVNTDYMGSLNYTRDVDYFEFSLTSEDTINIDFEHAVLTGTDNGWRITLYDDQDTWIEEFTSRLNQSEASSASIGLAAGIYYVKVDLNVDSFGRPRSGWAHSNVDYKMTIIAPSVVSVDNYNDEEDIPYNFNLLQNYPNPFNPVTNIEYELSKSKHVVLTVYNTLGHRVVTLVDEYQPSGRYNVTFDSKNLSSGVYFYRIQAGEFVDTKKMLLLR